MDAAQPPPLWSNMSSVTSWWTEELLLWLSFSWFECCGWTIFGNWPMHKAPKRGCCWTMVNLFVKAIDFVFSQKNTYFLCERNTQSNTPMNQLYSQKNTTGNEFKSLGDHLVTLTLWETERTTSSKTNGWWLMCVLATSTVSHYHFRRAGFHLICWFLVARVVVVRELLIEFARSGWRF